MPLQCYANIQKPKGQAMVKNAAGNALVLPNIMNEKIAGYIPGSFPGFLNGTNFAPMARAMGGPNMNPLASIPAVGLLRQVIQWKLKDTLIHNIFQCL